MIILWGSSVHWAASTSTITVSTEDHWLCDHGQCNGACSSLQASISLPGGLDMRGLAIHVNSVSSVWAARRYGHMEIAIESLLGVSVERVESSCQMQWSRMK